MSSNRQHQASSSNQVIEMDEISQQDSQDNMIDYSDAPTQTLENSLVYSTTPSLGLMNMFALSSKEKSAAIAELALRAEIAHHILHATPALPDSTKVEDTFKLKAVSLLAENPRLLFTESITEISPTGAICQGSPLQLALGAGDVWLVKALREQVFPHYHEGAEQAQVLFDQQFKEQFPHYEDHLFTLEALQAEATDLLFSDEEKTFFALEAPYYDERNIQQIIAVKRALMAVVNAITADNCDNAMPNPKTQSCIDGLKAALTPNNDEIIKTGLHFPLFMLMMVADVYRAQHVASTLNQEGAWYKPIKCAAKWSVYSRLVLGLVQKHLTAVDGQSLKNGLDKSIIGSLNGAKRPDRQDGLYIEGAKGQLARAPAIASDLGDTAFMSFSGDRVHQLLSDPRCFDFTSKIGWSGQRSLGCDIMYWLEPSWFCAQRYVLSLTWNKNKHYSELLRSPPKRSQDIVEVTTHRRNA